MSWLNDRQLNYQRRTVRPNSLNPGDIVEVVIDGKDYRAVVLDVIKKSFDVPEDEVELYRNVRKAGEQDKVSPGFDEYVKLRLAYTFFDDDDTVHIREHFERRPEWGMIDVYK